MKPQGSGVKIKEIFELPPFSFVGVTHRTKQNMKSGQIIIIHRTTLQMCSGAAQAQPSAPCRDRS